MFVGGPGAQIVRLYFNQLRSSCSANDSIIKRLAKEVGKDRDYVKAQHDAKSTYNSNNPGGGSIRIFRLEISTSRTIDSTRGIKRLTPSLSTTASISISAPSRITSLTVPTCVPSLLSTRQPSNSQS